MKISKLLGALVMLTASMVSCTWDQVEPEPAESDGGNGSDPVLFETQIQPIFTAKCVACHPPTQGLDLTAGNAYNNITQSKYMDLANPDQSLIYTYPNPTTATHSYRKYSTTEAALLLKWIEEGAVNN